LKKFSGTFFIEISAIIDLNFLGSKPVPFPYPPPQVSVNIFGFMISFLCLGFTF